MKAKQYYLEFIRAICMFLVIFNHTGTKGFMLYTVSTDSPFYLLYMFISIACKVAVPLYWMVSGALLLPKEESIKDVYKHRVLRMVLVLIFFSLLTYVWKYNVGRIDNISVGDFLENLYSSNHTTAYWFIYSYIGMLLILPLLRKLVKSMQKEHFIYLLGLIGIVSGVIPIVEYLIGHGEFSINSHLVINIFSANVMYFIGGYYFGCYLTKEQLNSKSMWWWIISGVIAIFITAAITQYKIKVTGFLDELRVQEFYKCLIFVPTFAIFYTCRYIFNRFKVPIFIENICGLFGSTAFGIMLIEHILRYYLSGIYDKLVPIIKCMPACLVYVLCVYILGFIIVYILKQVPGLKKII